MKHADGDEGGETEITSLLFFHFMHFVKRTPDNIFTDEPEITAACFQFVVTNV
jgi:hypothetical protein